MTDEPIFLVDLVAKRGLAEIGVLVEQTLIGESYLKNFRSACRRKGIRIVAEASIAQTAQDINEAVQYSARGQGGGDRASAGSASGSCSSTRRWSALDWDPPRFTTTAFQNAWVNPIMWNAFLGWIGVDQYDEGNKIGQAFLDRYAERVRRQPARVLRVGGQSRRRRHAGAGVHRRASAESAGRQGGAGEGQDDAGRVRRAGHAGVVRQVDAARVDGHRLPGRPHARCRRRQLAPGRPVRRGSCRDHPKPAPAVAQTTAEDRNAKRRNPSWGRWIAAFALLAFFSLFVAFARTEVHPRVANPNVEGRPRPVEFLFGWDDWLSVHQIGRVILLVVLVAIFVRRLAARSGQPDPADVPVHDADRLAGPDHELGAVRGLQPRSSRTGRRLAADHRCRRQSNRSSSSAT